VEVENAQGETPDTAVGAPPLSSKAVPFETLPLPFQRKRADLAGRDVEFKDCHVEMKADRARRRVEGFFTGFGNIDHGDDMIVKGALAATIADRHPKKLIKYFLNHESGLGMPEFMEEQDQGAWGVFKVTDTPEMDKYVAQIEDGTLAHHSIGYTVLKSEPQIIPADPGIPGSQPKRIRVIKELKLYEVSAVYWPMNEMATIAGVKSMFGKKSLYDLTEILEMLRNVQWALGNGPSLTSIEANLIRELVDLMSGVSTSLGILLTPGQSPLWVPPTIEAVPVASTASATASDAEPESLSAEEMEMRKFLSDPQTIAALGSLISKVTAQAKSLRPTL
jgi:HK97 family phage prohead protease